jgi:hypothetical protein
LPPYNEGKYMWKEQVFYKAINPAFHRDNRDFHFSELNDDQKAEIIDILRTNKLVHLNLYFMDERFLMVCVEQNNDSWARIISIRVFGHEKRHLKIR